MWASVQLLFSSTLWSLISVLLSRNSRVDNRQNEIEVNGSGSLKFTQEEQIAIDEFRPMMSDVPLDDFESTDYSLLRWIKARNFKLDQANIMLPESMEWRESMKWDTILNETILHVKHEPCIVDGTDRSGNIILYVDMGKDDIRRYVIQGQKEAFTRYLVQCAAKSIGHLKRAWKETGNDGIGVVILTDLSGYNIKQHGCFSCLGTYKELAPVYDNNFPYITKLMVLVNGAPFVRPIVQMMLPLLSVRTANAVNVFSADRKEWEAFLLKHIAPDQLSKRFGGTRD